MATSTIEIIPIWLQITLTLLPITVTVVGWCVVWRSYIKQKKKEERLLFLKESFFLLKNYTPLMKEVESINNLNDQNRKALVAEGISLKRQAIKGLANAIHNIQLFGSDEEQKYAQLLISDNEGKLMIDEGKIDPLLSLIRKNFKSEISQDFNSEYDSKWAAFVFKDEDFV